MPEPVRIFLIDDHPLMIDGLRLALDEPGLSVVGDAGTLAEARARIMDASPDVVLLDLHLPDGSGMVLIPELANLAHAPKVIVLTLAADPQLVARALQAGAAGYLAKGARREEIARTVHAVAEGQLVVGSSVPRNVTPQLAAEFPQLSSREREVLRLLGAGRSNAEIGRRLGITGKTVANHVSTILLKLSVEDRTQAALLAVSSGLAPDSPE